MRHRGLLALMLLLMAPSAWAQNGASSAAAPKRASATVAGSPKRPAKAAVRTTVRGPAKHPAKPATTASHSAPDSAKGAKETRTLQDIHIEGEIPVPQVLFITARDQRRFVDFQYQRYLKTSQEVGTQTAFPSRILVIGSQPTAQAKETRP